MRSILLLVFVFLVSGKADATLPPIAYRHDLFSQNERVYFHAVPFEINGWTSLGKTIVYDAKTKKEIYRIKNFVSPGAFITNNGRTIIDVEYELINPLKKMDEETILTFFIDGKKRREYTIANICKERLTVRIFERRSHWADDIFINNDTLYILTLYDQAILLNANNGDLISIKNREELEPAFDLAHPFRLKEKSYPNAPELYEYGLPDLQNGKKFRNELTQYLKMSPIEEYEHSRFYLSLFILIDKQGTAKIYLLDASKKGEDKEYPDLKAKVERWFKNKKFKKNALPPECDQWVFKDYFYLVES